MRTFNTGAILPLKQFANENVKGGEYHDLLSKANLIIQQYFSQNNSNITETRVAEMADTNAMLYKTHPQLRDTIQLLRMFVFETLDKPEELKDLPAYDKYCFLPESLYTVVMEERKQFQEMLSELKYYEQELSLIDAGNPAFDEKYPVLVGLEFLPYKSIPEEFHGIKSINQMRKTVIEQIDEYKKLELRLND